ncbi:MAG TPA: hypothetical protein PK027_12310 [Aquimonas sp.]|nr:hypothetical protein [Aquimonas sp.]
MSERIIDYIGGSEDETARLRLLLRMAGGKLKARWRFSDSETPDLLLLDPETSLGRTAREAAIEAHQTFISVVDLGVEDGADWALRRPIKLDALVRMLNALMPTRVADQPRKPAPVIVSQGESFFDLDLNDAHIPSAASAFAADGIASTPRQVQEDYDALFKRDPMANTVEAIVPHSLHTDTSIEYTDSPTARTHAKIDLTEDRVVLRKTQLGDPNIDPTLRRQVHADDRSYPLSEYLDGSLLGAAEMIEWSGLPLLVIDPVEKVFHSPADLAGLELYALQRLPRNQFKSLTRMDLGRYREMYPAKPLARLRWLIRYLGSGGQLSTQLDPGGSFRLTRYLELAKDYPVAFRISSVMMRGLMPLHEIAKLANAGMNEVIDVVNAYDTIGYLEHEMRPRFKR